MLQVLAYVVLDGNLLDEVDGNLFDEVVLDGNLLYLMETYLMTLSLMETYLIS